MPVCSSCGRESAGDFKFCPYCAAPFAPRSASREQRKTVTVVFCDVAGSTAMGERLDPESMRQVLARYFESLRLVVERHGGSVEKFIGDAVMAVFGVPVVHEDDALRAVRAATEMMDAIASLNEELARDYGTTLTARIGVNTGEVVSGTEERLATGDAVNVAARLEQSAAPGEILVGSETLRLVRDAVEVGQSRPLELKGKSEPVTAFRVISVHVGAPGHERKLDMPMVGRERELGLLRQEFDRVVSDRSCHLVTLLGAAGVGKSRLAYEFLGRLENAVVARGRCLNYGEGIAYWPVVEILKQLLTDEPGDVIRALGLDDLAASALRGVLGDDSVVSSTEEIAWAVRKLFEAVAASQPLVVVFDDIHWAEETFLDLIEHVADLSRDAPILLFCMARPELLDARPGWGGGKLNATSLLLEPLAAAETALLIERLLGDGQIDDDLQARITEAAEGNPLFVEEMVELMRDAPNGEVAVPATIQALLAARLDQLDASERGVLERGSVEGRVFHRGAVQALAPQEERVLSDLTKLVRKELIRPERPQFAGEDAYRFRHLLIRDAAYDALPKATRAELHERFAAWLEEKGRELVELDEIVGYHLEQAHRYRTELGPLDEHSHALAERAAERLETAGQRAGVRGDVHSQANLLLRATSLLPRDAPQRLALLPLLELPLYETGQIELAESIFAEAVEIAAKQGDAAAEGRLRAAWLLTRQATSPQGWPEIAAREADRLIPLFESLGDERGQWLAWRLRSDALWFRGRYADVLDSMENERLHARGARDLHAERRSMRRGPSACLFGPTTPKDGARRCEELITESGGNRELEFSALLALCVFRAMEGHFEEARELIARMRAIDADLGSVVFRAIVIMERAGMVEMLAGDYEAAEREDRARYELLEQVGEKGILSTCAAWLARYVLEQPGREDEALRLSEISEELAASDDYNSQIGWRMVRARVLAGRGEYAIAEQLAQEAVAIAELTDALNDQGDTRMALAAVLALAGRNQAATAELDQALALYAQKGNLVTAELARRRLTELL